MSSPASEEEHQPPDWKVYTETGPDGVTPLGSSETPPLGWNVYAVAGYGSLADVPEEAWRFLEFIPGPGLDDRLAAAAEDIARQASGEGQP